MDNPFGSIYEDRRYYVYQHIVDGEIVYIGYGSGARAWMHTYPFRAKEHAEYLCGLVGEGLLPCDWVVIISRNLTKEEALKQEQQLLKEARPRFNKVGGALLLKITPEVLNQILAARECGTTYQAIAEDLGLAVMTVHRAVNKGIPALEVLLEQQRN